MGKVRVIEQGAPFHETIHGLFLVEPPDPWALAKNFVAYPLAYDYGLFTSIFTYPNLLTLKTS